MGKDQEKIRGEILKMKTISIGKRNEINPIEWKQYEGEDVCINMTIRKGERIRDMKFFEDRVKAVPRGNAYCIGNGPSRKGFDLNKLKQLWTDIRM
jgi:hypothetical protein